MPTSKPSDGTGCDEGRARPPSYICPDLWSGRHKDLPQDLPRSSGTGTTIVARRGRRQMADVLFRPLQIPRWTGKVGQLRRLDSDEKPRMAPVDQRNAPAATTNKPAPIQIWRSQAIGAAIMAKRRQRILRGWLDDHSDELGLFDRILGETDLERHLMIGVEVPAFAQVPDMQPMSILIGQQVFQENCFSERECAANYS